MRIEEVKNFIEAGEIKKDESDRKKALKCEWFIDKELRKDNRARLYILVSDGIIKKIGGSGSKGGLETTINFYLSANTGKPSIRSFAVQKYILKELDEGKSVKVYATFLDNIIVKVRGLSSEEKEVETLPSFKCAEENCLNEYFSEEGEYPEWNKQESGKKWLEEEDYIKSRKGEV